MNNDHDRINQLQEKLQQLLRRQDDFAREINNLRIEIANLRSGTAQARPGVQDFAPLNPVAGQQQKPVSPSPDFVTYAEQTRNFVRKATSAPLKAPGIKLDLEKFIGENLINKIGIAITVIGVGIGAKYAIDHQLISPLTRIILGYLVGLCLFGFAVKLKKDYKNFSAVLLSGSMAVMYLITYAAYDYFGLVPNVLAFALMVIFTAFTVSAAIVYNLQVIAHIGLVGAYAVPFLLSDGSGNVVVLFSYMAIINIGILFIAFKKNWKPLYYVAFVLTWIIFLSWHNTSYVTSEHFAPGFIFLSVFFATFYVIFLAYKLVQKEKYGLIDVLLLLANSFIFFGLGYGMLNRHATGNQLLGLFTLLNAIIHFVVSVIIFRRKLADKELLYFVTGLVLVFVTLAVPVQLDGNWVTLLWAGEAALLFWIGRIKGVKVYEILSYPLMVLAFFSIGHDWMTVYSGYDPGDPESRITPLLNVNFLTSLLFIGAFGFIFFLHLKKEHVSALASSDDIMKIISFFIPAVLLFSIYNAFHLEIANYWNQLYKDSGISVYAQGVDRWDYDLKKYRTIWLYNYTFLFVSVLGFVNMRWLRNTQLGFINLGLIVIAILLFLTEGLYVLSELRESYLSKPAIEYYHRGAFSIGIRYVSFVFLALAVFVCHKYRRQQFIRFDLNLAFDFLLHTCILWVASSELINLMDLAGFTQSYKLGLSILWGSYSLMMIVLGIWRNKRILRIWAIALFGVTLLKLFFFDIAHLDTIAKTVVFVSLGVLLLVISFLYIKYRNVITDEPTN